MNPYYRSTAAPAPASAPAPAPAYPAQSSSFQRTAAAAVHPGQAPPTAQPAYPAPRVTRRAEPYAQPLQPSVPSQFQRTAPPPTAQPAYRAPRAAPYPAPGSANPAPPHAPRPGPVRRRPWDDADRAARDAATRAVPVDLWRPGAGAVRYYPANRHDPPNPTFSTSELMRRHGLLREGERSPPPTRRRRANSPDNPRVGPSTVPVPAPAPPAPAPAGNPPAAQRAQNPYNYYPAGLGRR